MAQPTSNESKTTERSFPLHSAAFKGNVVEVAKLLEDIDVNDSGVYKAASLHSAGALSLLIVTFEASSLIVTKTEITHRCCHANVAGQPLVPI
jgi:hypothetical protein